MPERVFQSCNEERARSGGRAGGGRVNWNLVLRIWRCIGYMRLLGEEERKYKY